MFYRWAKWRVHCRGSVLSVTTDIVLWSLFLGVFSLALLISRSCLSGLLCYRGLTVPFACRAFRIIRSGFTDEKTDIAVKSLPWTHGGRPIFWNSNCRITKPRLFPGTSATRARLSQHICLKHAYWIGFSRAEAEWHRSTIIRALRQWVGEKNSCLTAQVCLDPTPWLMWLDQSALRSSDFRKEMGSVAFCEVTIPA